MIKDGSTSPVSRRPWHRERPGHAEKTESLLASPAACRRNHPSATLAPAMFYTFTLGVSPKRSHVCSRPGKVFSLGGPRGNGSLRGRRAAWRAARCPPVPAAHGCTPHAVPGCPCSRAPAAPLDHKNPEGRRTREALGNLPPPETAQGTKRHVCSAKLASLHLPRYADVATSCVLWAGRALSMCQGKVPCPSLQCPDLESLSFRVPTRLSLPRVAS